MAPGALRAGLCPELDNVVMRGLSRDADRRFASAFEMATSLEQAVRPASAREVSEWVRTLMGDALTKRAAPVAQLERLAPSERVLFTAPLPTELTLQASLPSAGSKRPTRSSRRRQMLAVGLIGATGLGFAAVQARSFRSAPAVVAPIQALSATNTAETTGEAGPPGALEQPRSGTPAVEQPPRANSPGGPVRLPSPRPRNCKVPYTVDANGIHIPKPECL